MSTPEKSTARFARVRELFDRAASLDRAGRDAYLASACSDDSSLRVEVEQLLEQHDRSTELLDTETFAAASPGVIRSIPSLIADRFEIVRKLGAGGMGEVYEARDRELNTKVALKMVRSDLVSDPKIRDRFRHEILNGRRVAHPNVCRIHDLVADHSSDGDSLCFTMELLSGETLADLLKRERQLATECVLPLAREMAAGLAALHESGIVHRDFKPANVMLVDGNGNGRRVKLTDFGLARYDAAPEGGGLTSVSGSKDIIGTPIYMAPEQLVPDKDKIGPATDVYAFGLVLYEMVTGERPFAAKSYPQNLVAKTMQQPTPPCEHVPDLDPKWNDTILACLSPEPKDRPQSPTAVLEMLEGRVEPPVPRRQRLARRIWTAVAAMVVILVALSTQIDRLPFIGGPEQSVVAVLPLTESDDPWANGFMARVNTRLTQFESVDENLTVMDPSSVRGYGVANPQQAARELGVNRAVMWDFQPLDDTVEFVFAIVDGKRGRQLDTVSVAGSRDDDDFLYRAVRGMANALKLQIRPEDLGSSMAASQAKLGADAYYDTGLGYLQHSDVTSNIDKAITQFDQAIALDGEYALARAGLCDAQWRMYQRTGDPQALEDAEAACDEALRLNHQLPEIHIAAGNVETSRGEYKDAIASFQAALEGDPKNVEALAGLATAYSEDRQVEKALATYDRAIGLRPHDWRVHERLGIFHIRMRDYEAAIKPLQDALNLLPESPHAMLNLAAALQGTGELKRAKDLYQRANDIEPRPYALANLATIYFREGRYEETKELRERAVSLKPHDYELWQELATIYEYVDDPRVAETYLKAAFLIEDEALRDNPRREDLYSYLAHCYAGADQIGQSRYWLAKATERRDVADWKELFRNAKTSARLGDVDTAFEWIRAAEERGMPPDEIKTELEIRIWLRPLLQDPRATGYLDSPDPALPETL